MELPLQYRWLKAHDFKLLTPWYFIDSEDSDKLKLEYKSETGNEILPFARRQDNDDIGGFEILNSKVHNKVITVHLTWAGKREKDGYPRAQESKDLMEWISEIMVPATIEFMSEEDLKDLEV